MSQSAQGCPPRGACEVAPQMGEMGSSVVPTMIMTLGLCGHPTLPSDRRGQVRLPW